MAAGTPVQVRLQDDELDAVDSYRREKRRGQGRLFDGSASMIIRVFFLALTLLAGFVQHASAQDIAPPVIVKKLQVAQIGPPPMVVPLPIVPWYAASCTYVTNATSTAGTSTVTFSGIGTGTAAPNRYNVVGVGAVFSGGTGTLGLTVAGTSATSLATKTSTNNPFAYAGLFIASNPTGTTATIVATWTGTTAANMGITVYSCINLRSATPTATNSSTDVQPLALTLTINDSGSAIGMASHTNTGTTSGFTWSNLTRDSNFSSQGANGLSSASGNFTTGQSSLAITATESVGGTEDAGVVVAFR